MEGKPGHFAEWTEKGTTEGVAQALQIKGKGKRDCKFSPLSSVEKEYYFHTSVLNQTLICSLLTLIHEVWNSHCSPERVL